MTLQDLLDLEARRPELPRPVPGVGTPEWDAWRRRWDAWMADKEEAMRTLTVGPRGCSISHERWQPACPPRADYIYREPINKRARR